MMQYLYIIQALKNLIQLNGGFIMHQQKSTQKECTNKNSNKHKLKKFRTTLYCSILAVVSTISFLGGHTLKEEKSSKQKVKVMQEDVQEKEILSIEDSTKVSDKKNKSIDINAWNLMLVNSTHPIADDFKIELTQLKNGHSVDSRIYKDLQAMMDAARADGLSPIICSSYRTMERQTSLFNKEVNSQLSKGYSQQEAEQKASYWVAIPGTSEHQLGLAVDIVAYSYQTLDKAQEQTAEQKWLMKHCAEYGFILRYPTDKSEITGIGYEPWHYRYVGKEIAKEIMEQGICLEEYLEDLK